jgi:hypothetical protein
VTLSAQTSSPRSAAKAIRQSAQHVGPRAKNVSASAAEGIKRQGSTPHSRAYSRTVGFPKTLAAPAAALRTLPPPCNTGPQTEGVRYDATGRCILFGANQRLLPFGVAVCGVDVARRVLVRKVIVEPRVRVAGACARCAVGLGTTARCGICWRGRAERSAIVATRCPASFGAIRMVLSGVFDTDPRLKIMRLSG